MRELNSRRPLSRVAGRPALPEEMSGLPQVLPERGAGAGRTDPELTLAGAALPPPRGRNGRGEPAAEQRQRRRFGHGGRIGERELEALRRPDLRARVEGNIGTERQRRDAAAGQLRNRVGGTETRR